MLLEALGVEAAEKNKKKLFQLVFCIVEICKKKSEKHFGRQQKHKPQAFYRNAFKIPFDDISDCLLVVQRRHMYIRIVSLSSPPLMIQT